MFDNRNIIVLTNAGYADIVRENLPEIPIGNVIAEPAVRDTAGAIGLAAAILTKVDANATMTVVTADQLIEPDEVFQSVVKDSLTFLKANPEALITYGIKPTYAATQLYKGPTRFVLGASGHIAGVVNPPAANKYGYWTNDALPVDPNQWLEAAQMHEGSWWTDWNAWEQPFNGEQVPAREPGAGALPALEDAPGSYVKARTA